MINTDTLVVGAGIAGVSVADRLANLGVDVTVVDGSQFIPEHATGRSAALYSESYASTRAFAALSSASREFFFSPNEGFSDVKLVNPRDTIYISGDNELARWRKHYFKMKEFPAPLSILSEEEIVTKVPILRPGAATIGTLEHGSADMDVDAIWSAYRRSAIRAGAQIITKAEVLSAERGKGFWKVKTKAGDIIAKRIVNAAGAWGDQVAGFFGVNKIGLRPLRRTAFVISPSQHREEYEDMPFVFLESDDLYFRYQGGAFLMSPADETPTVPRDEFHEDIVVATALARFEEIADIELSVRPTRCWAGIRTFTDDLNPTIGFDPKVEGFFWLVGQGGYGIQTSPAISLLASSMLVGKEIPKSLKDFGIEEDTFSAKRFLEKV